MSAGHDSRFETSRMTGYALKIAAIALFALWTNTGFLSRIELLLAQARWVTLVGFLGVWSLSLIALLAAAFQSNRWLRFLWAAVIAFTTAVGFAYHRASGSDFGVLDALTLWNAKHEASRAASFYAGDLYWFAAVLAVGFVIFAMPPAPRAVTARRWMTRAAWLPVLPIAATVAIIFVKEGGGSEALPTQFEPLSVGVVLGSKLAANPLPKRHPVSLAWNGLFTPQSETSGAVASATPIRRIIMVIDESVRGGYIDWTPGNPYTPELASLKDKIVNFGPAVSGGNCSHYSNAILRFAAKENGIGRQILSNPTIWQYAKKAGFRTVYIDGQAGFIHNPGKLQNFMTAAEARDIDGFYALDEATPIPRLDDKLLDIVLKEVKADRPVLIYANKNGAHFPYDEDYPESARLFRPTMSESPTDTSASRIRSYRNAVRWSVDRIMARLIEHADLRDTVIIYTSDHGQAFNPKHFTHCTTENPDPREGLVPLFVVTGSAVLRARFEAAANASRGHDSHFSIAPTVLDLLGYDRAAVAASYGASLLDESTRVTAFTSGDIFGLFAEKPRLHPVDLSKSYLEPDANPAPAAPPARTAQAASR
ncbi:MAG TPA: sulfatase-like hydrolase/transferase [Pseudolabrys sp.]|nr:sulfatase-like hydrolase/transferase [Pseudolabrys sp.]